MWPAEHFPLTPTWVRAAVADAIERTGVTADKWQVPLECMGRYESNYGVNANFCDADKTLPVGWLQLARVMILDGKHVLPAAYAGTQGLGDPVAQAVTAILHIDSRLTVTGGYGGIGTMYGKIGLLPREDRGPGNVLRAWAVDPAGFRVEAARDLYRPY